MLFIFLPAGKNLNYNCGIRPQTSCGLFKPTTANKTVLAVGTVAGAAAITIAALACTGVLTLNPVAFGLSVGLLAALSVGALIYAGVKAYQNHPNDNKGSVLTTHL